MVRQPRHSSGNAGRSSHAGRAGRYGAQSRTAGPTRPARATRATQHARTAGGARTTRTARTSPARRSSQPAAGGPPLRTVAFALVAGVVLLLAFMGLRSCAGCAGCTGCIGGQDAQRYASPYDWSNLQRENGRWAYVRDGAVLSRLGVDVSEAQGEIDWQQVAADGIDFAILRVGYRGTTEGGLYQDAWFAENLAGAQAAGLDVGVYFFSQATTEAEAREEADFVLERLAGVQLAYPVVFDSEDVAAGAGGSRTSSLSNAEMTAVARAFCARVEKEGYTAMVYGNQHDLSRLERTFLEGVPLWWAEYGTPTPTAQIDIAMWQYTNEGQVAGVSTNVDLDLDLAACAEV